MREREKVWERPDGGETRKENEEKKKTYMVDKVDKPSHDQTKTADITKSVLKRALATPNRDYKQHLNGKSARNRGCASTGTHRSRYARRTSRPKSKSLLPENAKKTGQH